jgi:hypothetical protein
MFTMNHLNQYILIGAFITALICSSGAIAQSPDVSEQRQLEQVKATELVELKPDTYASMAEYWKGATERNAADANAWLNYYKSLRYSSYTEHSSEVSKEVKKNLDLILSKMASVIPSTFEFYYASYLHNEKEDASFSYLKAAYDLNPSNPELYDDMLCHAVINGLQQDVKTFSEKLSASGIYNATEIEYNRNVFNSIEQNAILITNGNVDTYPLILMQQLQGFRADVMIICLDWLNSNKYREIVASKLGIGPKGLDLPKILNSENSRSVYLSLTLPPAVLKKYSNQLYCTGLAMKHSYTPLKNLESLAYNWEFLFAKSRLHTSDQINRNYLVPLIQLRSYYETQGRGGEAAKVDQQILELSQRFGLTTAIKKHLD